MIKILYKDKSNWVDLNNKIRSWEYYDEKIKPVRVHPRYFLPFDLTDTWNGVIFLVQKTLWDTYYCEFIVQNDELNEIAVLQACDDIIIQDLTQKTEYIVDKRSPENFIFNEPEQIGFTTAWKVSFIFRTNRALINKALPVLNTNTLICSYDDGTNVTQKTFYTDFDVIESTIDSEQESTTSQSDIDVLDYVVSKRVLKAVFYLLESDANDLKEYYEKSQVMTLNGQSIVENGIAEMEDYGEGIKKILIEALISSTVGYPSVQ